MQESPASRSSHSEWRTARGGVSLDAPLVLGILNVTPDSFSDGGRHSSVAAAVAHAERMIDDGADIIDIGGESTRPGAVTVGAPDEIARVVPVIAALLASRPAAVISVDTTKADVARAALDAGAAIINDVSGGRLDAAIFPVVAETGAGFILMHSRGTVETMASYELAKYGLDVPGDVAAELSAAAERAVAGGVSRAQIVLDPGLGFSKRTEHSVAVLAHLDRIVALGYPVLVGPSRKRFVADVSQAASMEQRLEGTIAACCIALMRGARLFRVHDVGPVRRALSFTETARVAAGEG